LQAFRNIVNAAAPKARAGAFFCRRPRLNQDDMLSAEIHKPAKRGPLINHIDIRILGTISHALRISPASGSSGIEAVSNKA
jgi:hypothetical protein